MIKNIVFIFFAFMGLVTVSNTKAWACSGCAAGFTGGGPSGGGGQCSNEEWTNKLIGQESGGNYGAESPNSSAVGRYQFIDSTRRAIGTQNNLPCSGGSEGGADYEGFKSCPALQDAYFAALTNQNVNALRSTCNSHCGTNTDGDTVTLSGMAAIAHNVGPACARAWAIGGRAAMARIANPPGCRDANGTDPVAKYGIPMGGFDMGGGEGAAGNCSMEPTEPNPVPYQAHLIGCDPAILNQAKTKTQALKQQETEAAKALITKPASVQQLTCFDQYTKINAEKIGRIHSDPPKGISDTIAPNVELPNMQSVIQNFMTGVLGGGLQSMLNNALGSLTGGLLGGGGGATGGCNAMGEMWNLLQCIDFPQMPSLSDILGGGGGGDLGGILSGLGGAGGLGSLGGGGGGGGIMGAVCQAMKGAMGGGGSGGTSAFEDLLNQNSQDVEGNGSIYDEDTVGRLLEDIQDTVHGTGSCDYSGIAAMMANMDADLDGNNIIEDSELKRIDEIYGNSDCVIQDTEIEAARAAEVSE